MSQLVEFVVNHWILWTAFLVLLGLLLGGEIQRRRYGIPQVGPNQAIQILNRDGALLLDVREDKELAEAGRIPNARHIPLAQLNQRLSELKTGKDKPVVAYCRSGSRSNKAATQLRKAGFEQVYNLAGGILAWENANLPLSRK
ncbi:MAG TPA: rhodanese-like domain-containing protein [Thiohalobacter sp.]|nr:rhodanese-like domain-containing protein [Thiohalobacter sp.]